VKNKEQELKKIEQRMIQKEDCFMKIENKKF